MQGIRQVLSHHCAPMKIWVLPTRAEKFAVIRICGEFSRRAGLPCYTKPDTWIRTESDDLEKWHFIPTIEAFSWHQISLRVGRNRKCGCTPYSRSLCDLCSPSYSPDCSSTPCHRIIQATFLRLVDLWCWAFDTSGSHPQSVGEPKPYFPSTRLIAKNRILPLHSNPVKTFYLALRPQISFLTTNK